MTTIQPINRPDCVEDSSCSCAEAGAEPTRFMGQQRPCYDSATFGVIVHVYSRGERRCHCGAEEIPKPEWRSGRTYGYRRWGEFNAIRADAVEHE